MRKDKILLDPEHARVAKRVLSSDDPAVFFPAAAGIGGRILNRLAKGPEYPSAIARELGVYHQTVYYHMKKLEKAGLVRRVGRKMVRGGGAHLYTLASDGYAVEFGVGGEPFEGGVPPVRSTPFGGFVREFIEDGSFNGWIVVGSPEPHGPNRTQGRDGHYAIQLGFALGQFVGLPKTFPVKLDVDLKNEKREGSNLLLVGGPRTNMVSAELNARLPIRFSEESFWGSMVDEEGTRYLSERDGLIAKIRNPWDGGRVCILAAGLSGAATKAAIIGMTDLSDKVLGGYGGGDFAVVVRGMDLDGDGKVDSVEVVHRADR